MGAPGGMSSLVIAGRLILLAVAAFATVWAFALSGGREHAASGAGEHVHGTHAGGAAEHDPVANGHAAHAHGAHADGPREHDHAASGAGPATSPAFAFPELANLPHYTLIASVKRRVYAREVRAPAWVEASGLVAAVLYTDEVADLSPEEHALFFRAVAPTDGIDVRLAADPPAAWDASTSRVRFRRDPGAPALGRGEVGWVTLATKSRERLIVPSTAVLYSSQGPYVLAASADGHTFTKRAVQIGRTLGGFAVVLAGLRDQDQVVVGNTFFLDAERRLRSEAGETVGVAQ